MKLFIEKLLLTRKHELDEELGTPLRNHIKFPHVEEKKTAVIVNGKKPTPELSSSIGRKVVEKKSSASDEYLSRTSMKKSDQKERLSSLAEKSIKRKMAKVSSQQEIPKKAKMANVPGLSQKNNKKVGSLEGKSSSAKKKEDDVSLGQTLYSLYMEGSETHQLQLKKEARPLVSETASKKLDSSLPKLDADSERRSVMPFLSGLIL